MNDILIVLSALLVVVAVIVWWFHKLAEMRRKVDSLSKVHPTPLSRGGKSKRYELSIPRQHFAYRAYNTAVDFFNRRIIVDRFADSECDHPERDQRR